MYGTIRTKHFDQRFQQRGLKKAVVQALIQYGEQHSSRHGIESLFFSKHALAEIKADHGKAVFKACERLRNAYLVMSEDGVLITIARNYRRAN